MLVGPFLLLCCIVFVGTGLVSAFAPDVAPDTAFGVAGMALGLLTGVMAGNFVGRTHRERRAWFAAQARETATR